MLLAALLSVATVQSAPAMPDARCHARSVGTVVRDEDAGAPWVLETADGHRFRTLGTDFIHVNTWKSGEPLSICSQQELDPDVKITNVRREEYVVAESIPERVYADTCVENGSGDVSGSIIALSGGGARPRVIFFWSEGALMQPVAVTASYLAANHRLRFDVSTAAGAFRLDAEVGPHALIGTLREPWKSEPQPVALVEVSRAAAEHPSSSCKTIERATR